MALPKIRACLFDMDGLLTNSEDLISQCINEVLAEYGKPALPWAVKAQLQGRTFADASKIFRKWADLPLSEAEFQAKLKSLHAKHFPSCAPLPGVERLLAKLATDTDVELALATSSSQEKFQLKTSHLQTLFAAFPLHRRVLGDDPRIPSHRHKPAPDIYLTALKCINDDLKQRGSHAPAIKPEECLVFEDALLGVEAGRCAGMQVIWCPHPGLLTEIREGRHGRDILAAAQTAEIPEDMVFGRADSPMMKGAAQSKLPEWVRMVNTLEDFDYASYGIEVRRTGSWREYWNCFLYKVRSMCCGST
jgi:pseudouridine-5'-monophosphatase